MLNPVPTSYVYEPPTDPWLTVLHADARMLVLDKPSGLLTVPGQDPALADCLEARARETWPTATLVHRLDKDTSGIVLMALDKKALGDLGQQFEKRRTKKRYVARVWGVMEADSGLVDMPLATDWENKPRQRVDWENGRASQTEWTVLEREAQATRVGLNPLTGRTHQLRVHMLTIGHPILGDQFYATGEALAAANRLQLHAEELTFFHPDDGREMTFRSPAPF
jgi:tRNA pseudouridine32 synthase/23S rRNA pseudouridine746 synthase